MVFKKTIHRQEGFSVAILEALACAVPVVISRHECLEALLDRNIKTPGCLVLRGIGYGSSNSFSKRASVQEAFAA